MMEKENKEKSTEGRRAKEETQIQSEKKSKVAVKNSDEEIIIKEASAREKKIEELTDLLKRIQAEFENYKKRTEQESRKCQCIIEAKFAAKLLPTLDCFDQALKHKDQKDFSKGIELVHKELAFTLEKEGLQRIDAVGKKLDPYKHEVMCKASEAEKEDDVVLEVLQTGYTFQGVVIRTAKVKVNQRP